MLDPCNRLEREGFRVTYLTPDRRGASTRRRCARRCGRTPCWSVDHARQQRDRRHAGHRAIGAICRAHGVAVPYRRGAERWQASRSTCTRCQSTCCRSPRTSSTDRRASARCTFAPARALLQPVIFGGGQERGAAPRHAADASDRRAWASPASWPPSCVRPRARASLQLRDRLWDGSRAARWRASEWSWRRRVADILNVSFEGIEGESL